MELKRQSRQIEAVIPQNWVAKKLGDVASFRTGPFGSALHKSDYTIDGIPVINPMHINDGEITPSSTMTISESAASNLSEFRLYEGEIIIGRRGDMGRCAVVKAEHIGWLCGTGSMIVRPGMANANFLQRILSSKAIIERIEAASVGTTMINLNQATLSGLIIQFPPLSEQKAIAGALSDIDELLASLDALITKKRDIKQAAVQQVLTGRTRLPDFNDPWHEVRIGEKSVKIGSGVTPTGGARVYKTFGRPFIRSQNIGWGELRLDDVVYIDERTHEGFSSSELAVGDVLLNITGASIGRSAVVDTQIAGGNVNQHVCIIRPVKTELDARFLNHFLLSGHGQSQIESFQAGGNRQGLNFSQVGALQVRLPLQLSEQTAIATILSDMDSEIIALEARRDKTRALKQGMMQELLSGRIRLL